MPFLELEDGTFVDTLSDTQWAYIAGMIDGDGSITISRHSYTPKTYPRPYYSPQLCIYNTNKEVIDTIGEWIGFGGVYKKEYKNHYRTQYIFRLFGKKAKLVLQGVLPYLIIKREQAEIVLDLPWTRDSVNREAHEEAKYKISELNICGR